MTIPIPETRQYLTSAYSDDELGMLCADYFRDVYEDFAAGMTKAQKIGLLLDYCQHRDQLPNLLAALKRDRPQQYPVHFAEDIIEVRPAVSQPQRDPRQVFISHAHEDAEFAHRLASDLQHNGWRVWIAPDSILPGEKWAEAINRGLEESGVFVVALTPTAVASNWVKIETNLAIELVQGGEARFFPLLVSECRPPVLWTAFQRILFSGRYPAGLADLLAALDQKEAKPRSEPTVPPAQTQPRLKWLGPAVGGLVGLVAIIVAGLIATHGGEAIRSAATATRLAVAQADAAPSPTPRPPATSSLSLVATAVLPTTAPQMPVPTGAPTTAPTPAVAKDGKPAIVQPEQDVKVRGVVQIIGSSTHPQFHRYELYYAPWPVPSDQSWILIGDAHFMPQPPGLLGTWESRSVIDGAYALRVRVVKPDGNYLDSDSRRVVVANQPATDKQAPMIAPTNALGIGSTQVSPVDGMILVYVPAGEFLMGSADSDSDATSDEKPQHKVTLDAFWIDRTEVTNAMFAEFVAASGYKTDAEKAGKGAVYNPTAKSWEETAGVDWQHPRGPGSDTAGLEQHPTVLMSWNDAAAYCAWAGRRLPTEAEWEKAARGTDGRKFPWGNQDVAGDLLNFADRNLEADWADKNINDGNQFTAPAGSYPKGASPYGALDMAGNVWEWVTDWYDENYYASAPAQNPKGPDSGQDRVLRGGSWDAPLGFVRAAYRVRHGSELSYDSAGFRCAGLN